MPASPGPRGEPSKKDDRQSPPEYDPEEPGTGILPTMTGDDTMGNCILAMESVITERESGSITDKGYLEELYEKAEHVIEDWRCPKPMADKKTWTKMETTFIRYLTMLPKERRSLLWTMLSKGGAGSHTALLYTMKQRFPQATPGSQKSLKNAAYIQKCKDKDEQGRLQSLYKGGAADIQQRELLSKMREVTGVDFRKQGSTEVDQYAAVHNEQLKQAIEFLLTEVRRHSNILWGAKMWLLLFLLLYIPRAQGKQQPRLSTPGDQVSIDGMSIHLHSADGTEMISIKSYMPATTYGFTTHKFDYREAESMEKELDLLLSDIEKGKPAGGLRSPIRPDPASMSMATKEACDCPLASNPWDWPQEAQPHKGSWVANHLETPGVGCPSIGVKDSFEVAIQVNASNGCYINPTPMTLFAIIQPFYKLSARETMKKINQEAISPCVTQGAYNLDSMSDSRYKRIPAKHMIDCQIQCKFMAGCSAWMFQDGDPSICWAIRTGRLRFQFSTGKSGISYTGGRDCLPCELNRNIAIKLSDKWLPINEDCTLHMVGKSITELNCPCQNQLTYKSMKEDITRVNLKAQANAVEKSKPRNEGRTLVTKVGRLIRSMNGQGTDHDTLRTMLRGGTTIAKLAMQLNGWEMPMSLASIDNLEPVRRLKNLFGPAYKITSQMVKTNSIRTPRTVTGRPGLTVTTNPFASLYSAKKDFTRFFQGKLQTNKAITTALQGVDNFLQEASMQKRHQMTNPRSMVQIPQQVSDPHYPLNGQSNTLMLSADKGSSLERVAIYPIEGRSKLTQITTVPVPTGIPDSLTEPPLPMGTTEFDPNGFMTNRYRSAIMGCMMQLAEGLDYPRDCETSESYSPLEEISIIPIKGNSSYKIVRIAQPGSENKILRLSCGQSAHFLALKGMSVLLLGPQCYLRDTAGNLLTGPWGTDIPEAMEEGFLLLYDKELSVTDAKLFTDNIHHGLLTFLSMVVLLLALDRLRTCYSCMMPSTHPPPSPTVHPEAYSPALPRATSNGL